MKPVWTSKTIAFNVLALVVIAAGYFGYNEFTADEGLIAAAIPIFNIVLRFVTNKGISFGGTA